MCWAPGDSLSTHRRGLSCPVLSGETWEDPDIPTLRRVLTGLECFHASGARAAGLVPKDPNRLVGRHDLSFVRGACRRSPNPQGCPQVIPQGAVLDDVSPDGRIRWFGEFVGAGTFGGPVGRPVHDHLVAGVAVGGRIIDAQAASRSETNSYKSSAWVIRPPDGEPKLVVQHGVPGHAGATKRRFRCSGAVLARPSLVCSVGRSAYSGPAVCHYLLRDGNVRRIFVSCYSAADHLPVFSRSTRSRLISL